MDMDKFSERAREALETAQGIVRRGPGNQLGTEHLLIGVLSLPDGVVEQVFNLLGVDKGTAWWAPQRSRGCHKTPDSAHVYFPYYTWGAGCVMAQS